MIAGNQKNINLKTLRMPLAKTTFFDRIANGKVLSSIPIRMYRRQKFKHAFSKIILFTKIVGARKIFYVYVQALKNWKFQLCL